MGQQDKNSAGMRRREVLRAGMGAGAALMAAPLLGAEKALAAAQGAPVPVNIVLTQGPTSVLLLAIMQKQRFLEDLGLAPTFLTISDGSKALAALISGSADICVGTGFAQVFPAIAAGAAVKLVAAQMFPEDLAVYSKRPNIQKIADLVGKTVGSGSSGSQLQALMVAILRKNGVDPTKVTFANVGSSAAVFQAAAAGVVDAGAGPYAVYSDPGKYGVHAVAGGAFWSDLPEYTSQGSYASDKGISEKRDVLTRVLAAYAKLYRFVETDAGLPAVTEAYKTGMGKDDPASAKSQWGFWHDNKALATGLVLSEERIHYMQELNIAVGQQKTLLPYSQVCDTSVANAALKLLG